MTSTEFTQHRDALRTLIARLCLVVAAGAAIIVVLKLAGALTSSDFASDFENGTHDYRGLDGIGYFLFTVPAASAIGVIATFAD